MIVQPCHQPYKPLRIGLLVNPVAGLGGAIGRKGSDGMSPDPARRLAEARMASVFATVAIAPTAVEMLCAPDEMGGELAARLPFAHEELALPARSATSADTIAAARAMRDGGVELILFAGGDGTACDLVTAIGGAVPVLGVPAGVKLHSAVFARSPASAGRLLARWAANGLPALAMREVLDRPGDMAEGQAPVLMGVLAVPDDADGMQRAKGGAAGSDAAELHAACARVAREERGRPLILGPGATMAEVKRRLGLEPTLLGVDLVADGMHGTDVDAEAVARVARREGARIVLGVVGGQGFLIGRGNQPIGADALRAVGREGLRIVASAAKLAALPDNRLWVDSGDPALDRALEGYVPVRTGGRRETMMRLTVA
jgi:predicted polyphosphate/ATP-dependent NAD kinase